MQSATLLPLFPSCFFHNISMFQNRNQKLEGLNCGKDPNGIQPHKPYNMASSFVRVCALVRIRNDLASLFVKSVCPTPSPNVSTKQSKRPNFCRVQRGSHLIGHHRMFEEKLYKRAPSYLHPLSINFPLLLVSIGFYMETKVFGPIPAGFKKYSHGCRGGPTCCFPE